MPKQKKSPDLAALLPPGLAKLMPDLSNMSVDLVKQIAALSVTRSAEYRSIYSDIFRARIGSGDATLIFSRLTHSPSIAAAGNVIEEQVEVVMSWPHLKMLEHTLRNLVDAIEQEIGEIKLPAAFNPNLEAQRIAIRSLGLSSSTKKPNPTGPSDKDDEAAN
jgi:hypothetical protein